MMDIKDLWIGEWVLLKDCGKTGRYEGLSSDGELKINIGNQYILTTITNIDIIEEPLPEEKNTVKKVNRQKRSQIPDNGCIDLHLEALAPGRKFSIPSRILDFQLNACIEFVNNAIEKKVRVIKIIHGKGEGILKSEVIRLLNSYDEIKLVIPSPEGGSVEVWLEY